MVKTGQLYIAWRKFRKNRVALFGSILVIVFIFVSVFAQFIAPYNPKGPDWIDTSRKFNEPSLQYQFGTDNLGVDIYSYIIWGGRSSIIVATGIILIEIVVALIIGSIAGYYGGTVDNILMRLTDLFITLPNLIILIVAVSMFKVRSISVIMVLTGLLWWPWMARVLRSQILTLREQLFVEAAKSMGASDFRIIVRHIIPNAFSALIVLATFDIAAAILYITTLSFLGLGDPNMVSWGNMINDGRNYLRYAWWISTFPGMAIFLTTLGFNLLGDGLRDAFDIKART